MTSGPGSVTVDHVNSGSGLQSLTVVGTPVNAVVMIPAFTPGTFNPVTATYFVPNPGLPVDFTLRAAGGLPSNGPNAAFIRTRCPGSTPPSVEGVDVDASANIAISAGESIDFIESPSGNAPSAVAPNGTISVTDGTNSCTITLPATSCILPSTSVGAKTLTATYNGDANYATSADTEDHQVSRANTTAIVTDDTPDPSVFGQNYIVSAGISANAPSSGVPAPTGTISISDGTNICQITLPATSCMLPSTSPGIKTLTPSYSGDSNYNANVAATTAAHTVNRADTTTTITSDNNDPSVFGETVVVNFTVAATAPGAGTPAGTVVVTVSGGAETCSGTVAAGTCSLPLTSLGGRTITAVYGGNSSFNASTDTELHQVNRADTSTAVAVAPNPATYGQTINLTATVTAVLPGTGVPQGTVNFFDGAAAITACQGIALNGSGVAACAVNSLNAGIGKTITANYGGNVNYNGSSGTATQTVNPAQLAVTASSHVVTYGAAAPAITSSITGFVLGQGTGALTTQPLCSTTYTQGSGAAASPYQTSCTGGAAANYSFTYTNGTVTVNRAALTVTADPQTKVYGQNNPALTATLSGFVLGQNLGTSGVTGSPQTTTTATTASPVGQYPITPAVGTLVSANYSFTNFVTGTLDVTRAALTVTADGRARVYGAPDPPFTATIAGFVLGQNLGTSGVTGSPAFTTTPNVTAASVPGSYMIIPAAGTLVSANYSFIFVNGALVISRAATTTSITNDGALANATGIGVAYPVHWTTAPVAPGAGVLTGNVTVNDGTGASCTAPVLAGTCQLTSTTIGPKTITATYAGDINFTGSTSQSIAHTVLLVIAGNVRQFIANGVNTNLAGVTVTLTTPTNIIVSTGTTDANGNFVFGLAATGGSYVVTPALANRVFEPISRTYNNLNTSITNADFIAYDITGPNALPRQIQVIGTVTTPGQSVTVPLQITSRGNERSITLTLTYDTALLGLPTGAVCGSGAANCTIVLNTSVAGRVGVTVTVPTELTAGTREFARITFPTAINTATSTLVGFDEQPVVSSIRNAVGDPLPALYIAGFVAFNQTAVTTFEGDIVNADGQPIGGDGVRANDVSIIREMALGLRSPTAGQYQNADAAPRSTLGDGCPVNAADVTQVARYGLALDPPTTSGGPLAPNPGLCQEPTRTEGTEKGNEAGTKVRVQPTTTTAGRQVTIPIEIDATGDEAALSFTLNWNPAVLTYIGSSIGTGVPAGANLAINTQQSAEGKLGVLTDAVTPYEKGTRQIMMVTFAIAEKALPGTYALTFSDSPAPESVSTTEGNLVPANFEPSSLIITDQPESPTAKATATATSRISGKVLTPQAAGLRNATIRLTAPDGSSKTATTSGSNRR